MSDHAPPSPVSRFALWLAFALGFLLTLLAPQFAAAQSDAERVSTGGDLRTLSLLASTWLSGYLSERSYNGIKTVWPWFDKQAAIVHQIGAPVFGFAFGATAAGLTAAQLLNLDGPAATLIGGVANALVMAGIFRKDKAKAPSDATAVVEATRDSQPV